jgi:hypothetical protein
MIALIPLNSSAIRAVGYFGGVLTIQFTSGRTYDHPGVPEWLFLGLLAAPSAGAFYNKFIRGKFR